MQHVLVAPFHQGEQHQRRDTWLWLVPMAALALMLGWAHPRTQMSGFFTKAALMTFGRGVCRPALRLPGAVTHYGWLTAGQMMDGLALGNRTPGPLIMVVTFVGFVGGYTKAVLGVDKVLLGGIAAACLVTWFTFCPRLSLFSPAGRL
ncbi:chromate transporter, CHR family [Klebsiella pneumoniae]|uniref:Chromate transporter, CHR family n=1 Tax=Klebsiella pneumoniae TaxID=573 RepID=A0A377X913_KLEPN|nr:chromate transporter, CHR family [Klebsiella pneumoniae]